ncbi:hypothetical protein Rt10032_c02g1033 [Rhodotorula toruloides]|uniref:Uncharacterized protein n=1 Tax=Rhodotorula toruloides TaxID=5286 RepID=A0A511KAN7_RHOTO|nr:hypothetical protein Rt10032_c02g1033 [Rhodotorula toruloides]
MGLFSRKKQRDHQQGPSTAATSSGARAPHSSGAGDGHASPTNSAYSSLPHQHAGGPASPPLPSPPERNRVFGALGSRASSSTLSLPAFGLAGRDDARAGEPRRRQVSATGALNAHEASAEREKGKWSRWKLGRGSKQRRDSVSSTYGAGGGVGGEADDGSGFVVKSFRTVSRVHEDPMPSRPSYSSTKPLQPTLTHLPASAPPFDAHDSAQPQESLRASLDYGSSRQYPRRPSLATFGAPNSSTGAWDPATSPTITAEAFRLASARSKSSVSLASLATGLEADPSSPVESSRPRFEPQRPASRTSRRGSSYSEAGVSGILAPPRPSFAMGQQANGSSSSIHSRASSNASLQLGMIGSPGPANAEEMERLDRSADSARPTGGMRSSESTFSVASFTTAPEGRSGASTPRPLSQVGGSSISPASAAPSRRPGPAKRMSTGDSELRLIASYGDMISSSPPIGSPIELPASFHSSAAPDSTSSRTTFETPQKGEYCRQTRMPSVSVQPPTPQSASGFSPVPQASPSAFTRQKCTSSLAPESVKTALHGTGVGRAKGKGKAVPRMGWVSDSSDENEASSEPAPDDSDSDSDDEVPLAAIRSRSQTDLTLRSSMDGGTRPVSDQHQQALRHKPSGELEVLKDAMSPIKSSFGPDVRRAGLGVSPLQRRGSNRRSVSTLSFSTSMTVSQAAAADAVVAAATSAGTAPSTPAPDSPTRSIMRPSFQPRSVSNPSTPTIPPLSVLSSSAASSATATPVPSPLFAFSARDRSSASSGSGTASSSSVPHTPRDSSPNVSDLNFSTTAHAPKPSVKFDLGSNADEAARWTKGRRMSMQSALGGGSFLHPPSSLGASFAHRSNPSLPTFAGFSKPSNTSVRSLSTGAPTHGRTASALTPTPASRQAASNASTSGIGSSASSTAVEETVYDRMKARHKAEAIEALKIGRDLNHPSGLVPDRERDDDDEDENEPLANLPTKGSVMGGGGAPSMMSGMSGMFVHPMAMGMGGTYSPLAVAPPGVDPYLYASLPPDQKMSLHQRASQMMAMMQEAAVRAKAESVAGSAIGGSASSDLGGGGSMHGGHMPGVSLGSYDAFYGGMYGQPQHPFQHHHHHMPSQGVHLPPFAPSFAMSQPFFQPQAHPGFYGMPAYAGSAIGLPSGPASTMSMPGAQRSSAAGRASSAVGIGQRRR